jgi:hypothetical protein
MREAHSKRFFASSGISVHGSIREAEQYQVDLHNVKVLELVIEPDIAGGAARASLKNLRLS